MEIVRYQCTTCHRAHVRATMSNLSRVFAHLDGIASASRSSRRRKDPLHFAVQRFKPLRGVETA